MKDPRTVVFNLIEEWERDATFPNLALKNALRSVKQERDRRFITALVYGVVERKITLDYFLSQCSTRKLVQIAIPVLSVLRMGLYQMFYMQVPASAACNTSVELIKQRGFAHSAGFVNAVLRQCDRDREKLLAMKKADFSVRYSIEPNLVELLLEQYGKEKFVEIMEGVRQNSTSIYLFYNPKRGNEEEFLSLLAADGVQINKTEIPNLYKASSGFSVEETKAYQAGYFHVIGKHSAKAALQVPKNAKKVMDLCAAPGGKTYVMASQTNGTVFSYDIHAHKVQLLADGAKRLGHKNVVSACADATVLMEEHLNSADFVLCDVPCSGLGIMGKKPDIKYKNYISKDFTNIQYQILLNGSRYLKDNGRLVYSTCTIDRRENELLVQRFLKENPCFTFDNEGLPGGQITFMPAGDEDGFYIAILKKGATFEN